MKILVVGDLHFRSVNPRARKDNFEEALLKKLNEVGVIASKVDAQALVFAGDLFDSPNVSLSTVGKLAIFLQSLELDVYAVCGNHDIPAGNRDAILRTPYGLLRELGIIQDVDRNYEWIPGVTAGWSDVRITGSGYDALTDTAEGHDYDCDDRLFSSDKKIHIHVVHSMLLPSAPGFPMRHTLIDDVETSADVIVCGHYHTGFGIIKRKDGKLFINPGALCRLSASEAEMSRTIQVAVIDADQRTGEVSATMIPLISARPADEVLDRESITDAVEHENWLNKYFESLSEIGEQKFLQLNEIVSNIADQEGISSEVRSEALRRIGEASESLNASLLRKGAM
jgi:exonuclease SbcD